jgi:hypothetical protein
MPFYGGYGGFGNGYGQVLRINFFQINKFLLVTDGDAKRPTILL